MLGAAKGSPAKPVSWLQNISTEPRSFYSPHEAVEELKRRNEDTALREAVEEYLHHDVPEYFKGKPIAHISRYVVSPNFETLRFIHQVQDLGLPIVASEDSKGIFVSQNTVKRALCKLPICRRITQKEEKLYEHYHNLNVIDFCSAEGRPFSDIETLWGEPLIAFHKRLFRELNVTIPVAVDDASWIDRHHRGNLLEHYKHLLALFIAHGIFFENYDTDDPQEVELIDKVVQPASDYLFERFGHRPLITQLYPMAAESTRYWISYPDAVRAVIRKSMHTQ